MGTAIDRASTRTACLFSSTEANSEVIEFGSFADMALIFPATYTATSISIRAWHGAWRTAKASTEDAGQGDDAWKEITTIVPSADAVVKLPDECFPHDLLKFVTNNAGSNAQIVWMVCKG
jgi:hypothetical protein